MPAAPLTRRRNDLKRRVARLKEQLEAAETELATMPPPTPGSPARPVWAGYKWYPSIAAAGAVHKIKDASVRWRIGRGYDGWRWAGPDETADTVPEADQGPVAPGLATTQGGTVVRWQIGRKRDRQYATREEALEAFHLSYGRDPLAGELLRLNVRPEAEAS